MTPRPSARGFTLLEVVVALAILGLSLMAIFDLNAGAIAAHTYTKHLTVGTLLARSKITDIEQKLYDDGFAADDQEMDGDFSDEGWSSYTWKAKILVPHTQDLPPEKVISALFGVPMGEGGLESIFGGEASAKAAGAKVGDQKSDDYTKGASPMAGAVAGMAQAQLTQMLGQIQDTVREVRLTVSWKDGKQTQSIDLTTDVVSLGQGSDRNGFMPGTNGQVAPDAQNPNGQPGSPNGTGMPGLPGFPGGLPQNTRAGPFIGAPIGGGSR